jgi:RHS repeat-associated protein
MYNAKGEKTWEADLDIYGKVRTFAGRSLSECPFRYQGQYEDSETGLYYNRFRYYDPSIGSYLSQDPIGLNGGMQLYNYVHDPNSWVDRLGLVKDPLNLSGGYTGRMDVFNMGHGTDFEIHVYDKSGAEVGIFGSEGWINKHGITSDVEMPDGVESRLKGMAVDQMRKDGRLKPKGTEDISGDKWKRPRKTGCGG